MEVHNKEENFWIYDLCALLKPINFIPYGDISSGSRLNAVTRIALVIYLVMIICKYKYANIFISIALTFLIVVHFCFKHNIMDRIITTKENFETLSFNDNKMATNNQINRPSTQNSYNRHAYNMLGRTYGYEMDPNNLNQNVVNSKYLTPNTQVDKEAGIQYYTPNHGINKNMFIEPVIIPRSLDREAWAYPSTYPSGMNVDTFQNTTEGNNFPEGVNRYALYRDGKVPYVRDDRNIYSNEGSWIETGPDPMITVENMVKEQKKVDNTPVPSQYSGPRTEFSGPRTEFSGPRTEFSGPRQKFSNNTTNITNNFIKKNNIASKYENNNMQNPPNTTDIRNVYKAGQQADYYSLDQTATLNNQYGRQNVTSINSVMSKEKDANYMIEPSPTYTYTDNYFDEPSRRLYMQDIQPNIYSYAIEQEPINNNIGISFTPQVVPRFRDQVYNENGKSFPLYTRVDPQLVRDDGTKGQIQEQPERGPWSAKYAEWNPPAGSINFEDIYDPRFTSYGDPYRSYSDVNLGQVQYYYSDVDAYRRPNFIIRSKVDFVDFHDPMGATKPYYERYSDLKDVKDIVQNRFDADQLSFREDLMGLQMQKRNSELWQLREAPLSKANYGAGINYGPSA